MTDRFRYRIRDIENNRYVDNPEDFIPWDLPDGFIAEQCTGIKDRNGKLIFEGDTVFMNAEQLFVVWDWCGCFRLENYSGVSIYLHEVCTETDLVKV